MLVPDSERPFGFRAKVLDFGIAKIAAKADAKVRTETGVMIGTPAYMAPEQCLGNTAIDGKADVYSLGVMLYEMLADCLPFEAQHSFDYMVAHVRVDPRPLRMVAPSVPEEVTNLVHSMLAKNAVERPSMDAVAKILDQLRAASPHLWNDSSAASSSTAAAMARTMSGPMRVLSNSGAGANPELALGATVPGNSGPNFRVSRDALPMVRSMPGTSTPSGPSASVAPAGSAAAGLPMTTPPPVSSPVQPRTGSTRSRVIATLAGGVVILGLVVTLLGRLNDRRANVIPAVAPTASQDAQVPPAAKVKWVVISTPAGAEVVRDDGKILGSTPWQLERLAGPGESTLTLRHPGFQDKALVLSHNTDVRTEVHLSPQPAEVLPATDEAQAATPKKTPSGKTKKKAARPADPKQNPADVKLLMD